jgi:hypothetical protein
VVKPGVVVVKGAPFITPPVQEYINAPPPVKITSDPKQTGDAGDTDPVVTEPAGTLMVTSLKLDAHGPLVIVHLKVELVPGTKPVTPELGKLGFVTEPDPATTVQVPVPNVGEFPANVAVVAPQDASKLVPALETDG